MENNDLDINQNIQENLKILSKLKVLSVPYDYLNGNKDIKLKQEKLIITNELILMISDTSFNNKFFLPNFDLITQIFSNNVFNPITLNQVQNKTEQNYWIYMEGIYKIFLSLLEKGGTNINVNKYCDNDSFLTNLVKLLNSNISEERTYVGEILYKLYNFLGYKRSFIYQKIYDSLHEYIQKNFSCDSIGSYLKIIIKINDACLVPERDQTDNFFKNIIISLHNLDNINIFFDDLKSCLVSVISKDMNLGHFYLNYILDNWPKNNPEKELLFLSEIENAIDYINNIYSFQEKFFQFLKDRFDDENEVVEATINLINKDIIVKFITQYKNNSYPILLPTIKHSSEHFNDYVIQFKCKKILEKLQAIDSSKYEETLNMYPQTEEDEERQLQLILELSKKDNNPNQDLSQKFEKLSINKNEFDDCDENYGICPITQDYMKNPVLSPSGYYYEKEAIVEWVQKHNNDPMTRQKISLNELIEDPVYRDKIIQYRALFNK